MTNNLTLTDVNMTQSHGPKSSMPTNVLDGQILLGRTDGKPTEQFAGTSKGIEVLSNSDWKNIYGDIENNEALMDALKSNSSIVQKGKLLYNKDGVKAINDLAHSTFDLSKFTVVGSPTITDDGIASGFSGSGQGYNGNNLYVSKFGSLLSNAKTYEFEFEVDLKEINTSSGIIACHNGWSNVFDFNFNSCNNSEIKISFGNWFLDSNNQVVTRSSGFIDIVPLGFALNDRVIFKQVVTETTLTSFVKKIDDTNWVQLGSTIDLTGLSIVNYPNANLHIGFTPNWNRPSLQPIDLKYISLKVDGKEVFNGNKTGIDAIKPNNFIAKTVLYAYTFNNNIVYADKTGNVDITELYNADGSYYLGTDFQIINNKVIYPEQATRGTDDITIDGATYYEFEHTTEGSSTNIYANDPTTPTALFNSDGSEYTGTQWNIMSSKIYYLNDATYASASNIDYGRGNNTFDAGPKITVDGIFTSTYVNSCKYVELTGFTATTDLTLDFHFSIISNESASAGGTYMINDNTNTNGGAYVNDWGWSAFYSGNNFGGRYYFIPGHSYHVVLEYHSDLTTKLSIKRDDKPTYITYESTYTSLPSVFILGYRVNKDYPSFRYVFDLNRLKLYSQNKLIFQPMLKIPYTESKTGSKIVDSIYRDRVNDAYQQGFNVSYFTLQSEQLQNFTKIGAPVISNANIASSFANANYLKSEIQSITLDKLDFYGSFTTSSTLNTTQYVMAIAETATDNANTLIRIAIDVNKRIGIGVHNNTTWTAYWSANDYVEANKTYLYHAYYSGGHIKLDISTDSLVYTNVVDQVVTVSSTYNSNTLWIGNTGSTGDVYFRGSIDLNAIKQLVNDELAYQMITESNFTLPRGMVANKLDSLERLDNLQSAGEQRLHALKGYEDTLKLLTDKIGYSNVIRQAHSTFDRSKFTVIGSPNITDEGTASGFGDSDYLQLFSNSIDNNYNTFEMNCKISYPSGGLVGEQYTIGGVNQRKMIFGLSSGKFLLFLGTGGSSWDVAPSSTGKIRLTADTYYYVKLKFDGSKYTLDYSLDGITYINDITVTTSTKFLIPSIININNVFGGHNFRGSIDLKQFSIIIDGIEVFSGNKTGIDTIKPDDYTVVGTPTISADGIYSCNKNTSNYIEIPSSIMSQIGQKNFDVYFKTKIPNNDMNYILGTSNNTNEGFVLGKIYYNPNFVWRMMDASANAIQLFVTLTNDTINRDADVHLSYKSGVFKLEVTIDGITQSASLATEMTLKNINYALKVGQNFEHPIDLNSFKIYVDGNLVYQSCLKIPYTEIAEGGKVADAIYRDRVNDVYQQNITPYSYYTLDEANQNYTLPMGNIYSLIEQRRADLPQNVEVIDTINQYKALETGNTANLPNVYEDIYKYKHSSFDSSKFTVIGSPNITSDGIASGFSNSNYLRFPTIQLGNYNSWEIVTPIFNISSTISGNSNSVLIMTYNTFYGGVRVDVTDALKLRVFIASLDTADSDIMNLTSLTVSTNTNYQVKISFTGTEYIVWYKVNNGEWQEYSRVSSTTKIYNALNMFQIGQRNYTTTYFNGQIDLKQFSITVDGVEVFSSNQTGIDIVKPNDFTSVTGLFAYKYTGGVEDTVYADASSNPTNLYNANGSYYTGSYYVLANDTVNYLNYAEYSSADNIIIGSTTYYAFKYDTHIIYANSSTSPTALYNNDGTAYTGTDWRLYQNTIAYLSPATYTQSSNIALSIQNATVDAGVKITDDGIASEFSSSNYLKVGAIDFSKPWKIKSVLLFDSNYSNAGNAIFSLLGHNDYRNSIHLERHTVNNVKIPFIAVSINQTEGTSTNLHGFESPNITYDEYYDVIIGWSGTEYYCKCKKITENNYATGTTYQSSNPIQPSAQASSNINDRIFEIGFTDFSHYFNGSIDLNSIKIYVNGDLVYQPMLRIPYTQSAVCYGSKVVNNYYKDRVQDAYDQNFSYKYYIIDEDNKTFNLPMGELYGMLEQRVQSSDLREVKCVIDTYRSGNDWYRVWSDGWCEQGGEANENVDVAFLKPFTNTNYTITATRQFSSDNNNITYYDKRTNYIQFRVSNDATGSSVISWMACGYIA